MTSRKCIALYSGGLDSILSIKMLQEQSIDVAAIYFYSPFFGFNASRNPGEFIEFHKRRFGITVYPTDFTDDIIRIVSNPKHGYGKHLNPCIDCKIGMIKKAGTMMESFDASFVVTGEVLGQRPMSQRRDTMNVIIRETGLKDLLLRPLCAKRLVPTLPEREGLVDRELLGDITGRGRKSQMELAAKYGLEPKEIPSPAGGCLLTYQQIAHKVRSTFDRFKPDLPLSADLLLDIVGRKFTLDEQTVLVVSRSEEENQKLSEMKDQGNTFIKIADVPGPLCIHRGIAKEESLLKAAAICLRYGKGKGESGHEALLGPDPDSMTQSIEAPVYTDEYCRRFQVDLNI